MSMTWRSIGVVEVQLHSFLTSALEGEKRLTSRCRYVTRPRGGGSRYLLNRKLVRPKTDMGVFWWREILLPAGIRIYILHNLQQISSVVALLRGRQLNSRTRHRVLAVAALNQSLSMVWWRWHISVSQLCCCWSMAVSLWVASITICVCFGVPPRQCPSLN